MATAIDTAQYYRNEAQVGQAIKESGLPCSEFFITTKVGTSGYRVTKKQIAQALRDLQTNYIDLMLVHWVMADYQGTYEALEEAYQEGKLKAIGLSNFNQDQIQEIKETFAVQPAVFKTRCTSCTNKRLCMLLQRKIRFSLNLGLLLERARGTSLPIPQSRLSVTSMERQSPKSSYALLPKKG
ncbi:oxidoreductase, aldo/keto reductase family protein [Streptococcus downei F0415]|nr:oxidoreductase, aldo/keto reductase family protein [Streptococcus downei F0415]